MKFLHAIVTIILAVFFVLMVTFRLVDGSFEAAGERMDRLTGVTASEMSDVADSVVETTGSVVDDIADGPDEQASPGSGQKKGNRLSVLTFLPPDIS